MSADIAGLVPGAMIYELRLATLANNLANVQTAGFKADGVAQLTALPDSETQGYTDQVTGARLPQGSTSLLPVGTYTDFTPGPARSTGNPLDVYIDGKGFFAIETPVGTRYTRNGSFTVDGEENLVTQDGQKVLGEGGPIQISGSKVTVDADGNVTVDGAQTGRLKIVDFGNPQSLVKVGRNLFRSVAGASENTPETVRLQQGALEGANVDTVRIMTEMIEVMRGYETYQKTIQTLDSVESKAVNELGRVRS